MPDITINNIGISIVVIAVICVVGEYFRKNGIEPSKDYIKENFQNLIDGDIDSDIDNNDF